MRESAIESALVRWAREHGVYTRKFSSPSQRGVPDRVFIYQGSVLFLELKQKGNKPTALQLHEIRVLREQGIAAGWVNDLASGKAALSVLIAYSTAGGNRWFDAHIKACDGKFQLVSYNNAEKVS